MLASCLEMPSASVHQLQLASPDLPVVKTPSASPELSLEQS